jgi:hypothetical protein
MDTLDLQQKKFLSSFPFLESFVNKLTNQSGFSNALEVYKLLLHMEKTINRRSPKLARVSTTQDVAWSKETT